MSTAMGQHLDWTEHNCFRCRRGWRDGYGFRCAIEREAASAHLHGRPMDAALLARMGMGECCQEYEP